MPTGRGTRPIRAFFFESDENTQYTFISSEISATF